MKKLFSLLLSFAMATGTFAQSNSIYGNFSKSDGTKLKGTSVTKGFENQIIINSYTGGSDNSGTIDIEVPNAAYVADFRTMMNAATASNNNPQLQTMPKTTVSPNTVIKPTLNKTTLTQKLPASPKFQNIDISINSRNGQGMYRISNKIVLQNVTVLAVTDDYATGSSKMKLKATRIGWMYYSYETQSGKISNIAKSGWDNEANQAWTNF